ncbi:hypothetical protein [Vibrio sonorensis]|uniref:hypothetical protein n=1 Tax=Vibrio sonorensis TaxID=1004316 RepID=UPI0008DAAA2B|nr:hypothetical protein [Vibrio sonorensis]
MKLFCIYSSINFDILDNDDAFLGAIGTGEYFIHYVGYERERYEKGHESRKHYFEGTEQEVMVQLGCQGKGLEKDWAIP